MKKNNTIVLLNSEGPVLTAKKNDEGKFLLYDTDEV